MTLVAYNVPILLIEQSKTHSVMPLRPDMSAPSSGRCMPDCAKHGVNEEPSVDIAEAIFTGYYCVPRTRTL